MRGKIIQGIDSDILIAILKNEPLADGVYEGIELLFKSAEQKEIILITSAIVLAEVFEGRMEEEAREKFTSYFDRQTIIMADADTKVMRLAGKIRNFHSQEIPNPRNIRTPDAIHLATALRYGATTFYTTDEKLLKLDKKLLGEKTLSIEIPYQKQSNLFVIENEILSAIESPKILNPRPQEKLIPKQ